MKVEVLISLFPLIHFEAFVNNTETARSFPWLSVKVAVGHLSINSM